MRARLCLLVVAICASCGGGGPPAPPAKTAPLAAASKAKSGPPAEEAPSAPLATATCEDGSCFPCGEALCLSGFYCSVAKAGHGCAWLPSCAGKATCACVNAAFRDDPGCACEERGGAVYLTCDGAKL